MRIHERVRETLARQLTKAVDDYTPGVFRSARIAGEVRSPPNAPFPRDSPMTRWRLWLGRISAAMAACPRACLEHCHEQTGGFGWVLGRGGLGRLGGERQLGAP